MKRLIVLTLLVATCGCSHTYYHARFPVLERPDAVQLKNIPGEEMRKMSPQAQADVAKNIKDLLVALKKYEVTVDKYNVYAKEQNEILDKISKKED